MTDLDRIVLSELANRLELAVDRKDWAGLRAMLCDEVTIDFGTPETLGGVLRPADSVVAALADGHPDAEVTYHSRASDVIDIEGDVAVLEGLQYAWSISADDNRNLYEVWGRMSYRFVREDGRWRVVMLKSAKMRDRHTPGGGAAISAKVRRVVTAEVEGKGIIASDKEVTPETLGAVRIFELWRAGAGGAVAPLETEWTLDPPAGGHVFRVSVVPPAAPDDAPWMHRTDTIDYVLILEGELTLVTDTGETVLRPGDVVVQQAANHGWINRTDRPVRMVVVQIDRIVAHNH